MIIGGNVKFKEFLEAGDGSQSQTQFFIANHHEIVIENDLDLVQFPFKNAFCIESLLKKYL